MANLTKIYYLPLKYLIMNFIKYLSRKILILPVILIIALLGNSCSSSKHTVYDDGIYEKPTQKVIVKEIVVEKEGAQENYFAKELDKYNDIEEAEIFIDEESYSDSDNNEDVYDNAAWGYDTEDVDVTYHVNYNWYHPYHNPGYWGYNWGYYSWYYPSYYYRPWSYYSYYGNPYYYGGYYSPYYYGYGYAYNPYSYGYGYYNPYYYGGYGYNAYNHHYNTNPNIYYGRRYAYANKMNNGKSLSRSVASRTVNRRGSVIRGSGNVSDQYRRGGPVRTEEDFNNTQNRRQVDTSKYRTQRNNTYRTAPRNTNTQRTTSPTRRENTRTNNTNSRNNTETRTQRTSSKNNNRGTRNNTSRTQSRSYNSGSSSNNSRSSGSSTSRSSSGTSSRSGSSSSSGRSSSKSGRR